jgi:hypothetical protein
MLDLAWALPLTDKSSTKIYGSVYGSPEIAIDSPSVPSFYWTKWAFDLMLDWLLKEREEFWGSWQQNKCKPEIAEVKTAAKQA